MQIEVCNENYLSFSWSGQNARKDRLDNFELHWKSPVRQNLNFKEEVLRALQLVDKKRDRPLALFMSGGIDSEIIARSLLEANIGFEAISFAISGGNSFDIRWARSFCKKNGIKHSIIQFDENVFVEDFAIEMANEFQCPDPYPLFECQRIKMVPDFFPIFGNGEPFLRFSKASQQVEIVESGSDYVVWQHLQRYGIAACYNFFKFTPELYLSYLREPVIASWVENANTLIFDELTWWKFYMYKKHWTELEPRQKWNGYESIAKLYFGLEANLKEKFAYPGELWAESYSSFINRMLP